MSQPATPWFCKAAQVSSFLIKNATKYLFYWYDCVQKKFIKTKYIRFSNEYLNKSRYSYKWNIFVIFLSFCYLKFVFLFKKLKLYYSQTVSVMRAAIIISHKQVNEIEQKIVYRTFFGWWPQREVNCYWHESVPQTNKIKETNGH